MPILQPHIYLKKFFTWSVLSVLALAEEEKIKIKMNIDISYHCDVEACWPNLVQEFPWPQKCLLPILFTSPSCTKITTHRDGFESSDVVSGGDSTTPFSYVIRFPQLMLRLLWWHCPTWHRKICDLRLPKLACLHWWSMHHQTGRTTLCKWVPHNLSKVSSSSLVNAFVEHGQQQHSKGLNQCWNRYCIF